MNLDVISIVMNNFKNDSRVLKEAVSLHGDAYNVTVVALYEDGLKEEEVINGIKVKRIRLYTKKWSKSLLIQILKYMEFLLKVIFNFRSKVDVIHCNDLGPLPIAVLMKGISIGKTKIIYDAHEYQTEIIGLNGLRKKLTMIVEKSLIKYVDEVITVSESIANEYVNNYKIKKPKLVFNCPNYSDPQTSNIFRELYSLSRDKKIFLYQGGLSAGRGIEQMLDVFTSSSIHPNATLIMMGYGPLEKKVRRYADDYNNIFYKEAVSPKDLLKYTSSADVGFLMTENSCLNNYFSLPNKLFEYIMAGLPVISNDLPEVRNLINRYNFGWLIEEQSVESIVSLVNELVEKDLSEYAVNSKKMSINYSWEVQEKTLLDAYRNVTRKGE
ncbi:glycosyltransferase [Bacillus sp. ISL-37]|uniref:glycosyltransferase n=1 Tax=Bacillus sp. ISL-37 TaxID=2819123 RepID=UPI001BE5317F|nr:glycosyltransferase [Bacillus sp. ISL-37]MBT2686422.1 glycosyltransferase [Bacillus sp. ISL-37]